MKRIITKHTIRSPKIPERLLLAVAPDIHSSPYADALDTFAKCDALLIPVWLYAARRLEHGGTAALKQSA